MPLHCFATVALCALVVGCSERSTATKGSLVIEPPAGWAVQYDRPGGAERYTLRPPARGKEMLQIATTPALVRPMETDEMAQRIAAEFVKVVDPSTLSTAEFQVKPFAGDRCKGSYAVFSVKNTEVVQVVIVLKVNGEMWDGQFLGPADDWAQALKALANIRKEGG
jgi:hypothetical protein